MTMRSFMAAVDDARFTGELRLAYFAFGDCNGIAGPASVMTWANCDEATARRLIDELVDIGAVVQIRGEFVAPELLEDFEADRLNQPEREPRDGSRRAPTPSQRKLVFARDGSRCVYCGCDDGPFHLDHVTPFSRGGLTEVENLVVACAGCNISKGSKTVEEWRGVQ